jgi:uncharacterized membrane protein
LRKPNPIAHAAYLVTILVKGLMGGIELAAGLIIAITGPQRLYSYALRLSTPELFADRHEHARQIIRNGVEHMAQSPGHFLIFYLLVHGTLKLTITVTLLRGRGVWIFPTASLILTGFIAYFAFHLSREWSYPILGLALFDGATLALVLNEWRSWRKH